MYLTRLRLDPRNAQARRDLADPYDMHRTLVRAFVRDERDVPPRILWRLEPGQLWSQPMVLVQSAQAGDWRFLDAAADYLQQEGGGAEAREFDPLAMVLSAPVVRFRLAANPTVSRDGKRLGLVGEDAQLHWLERQGERLGFELQSALVSGSDMLHGRKGGTRVSLRRVVYEGVLRVRDASQVAQAVTLGIGHGKAFGCGLLSLARSA